jgi:hypothetical protein
MQGPVLIAWLTSMDTHDPCRGCDKAVGGPYLVQGQLLGSLIIPR